MRGLRGFWTILMLEALIMTAGLGFSGKSRIRTKAKNVDQQIEAAERPVQADAGTRSRYRAGGMYEGMAPDDEIIERRDLATKHFRMPDGRAVAVISPRPVHYADTGGVMREIDTSVAMSSRAGFALENTTNSFRTYFPGKDIASRGILIERKGRNITIGKDPSLVWTDASGNRSTIERAAESAPAGQHDRVRYSNLMPSADNEFIVESDRLKNDFVLQRIPEAVKDKAGDLGYSETIQIPRGWTLRSASGRIVKEAVVHGELTVVNESGIPTLVFPEPRIHDGRSQGGGPAAGSGSVTGYFFVGVRGRRAQIITSFPISWLMAVREFPVVIDPTVQFLTTSSMGSWRYSCTGCSCDTCNPPIPPPPAYNPNTQPSPNNSYNHSGDSEAGWFSFDVSSVKDRCITQTQFKSLRFDHFTNPPSCQNSIDMDIIYVPVGEGNNTTFGNALIDTSHKLTTLSYGATDCSGPTNNISTDAAGISISDVISKGGTFTVGLATGESPGSNGFSFFVGPVLSVAYDDTVAVSPGTLPVGITGGGYSAQFGVTGNPSGTVTYSETGLLPGGMSLSLSGALTATSVTQAGTFQFTVAAVIQNHCTVNRNYTLVVCDSTMAATPASLSSGTAGSPYSAVTFGSPAGTAPFSFTESGGLPAGMSFGGGVLSGTPTQTGSFPFTVMVVDSNGCTGQTRYTLVINCQTIQVNATAPIAQGTAGVAYLGANFAQIHGIGTVTFAESGTLPNGMTFSTGTLSGTPLQTGQFPITVTATDQNRCSGSYSFTLTINCPTIVVNPSSVPMGVTNRSYPATTFTQTGGVGAVAFTANGLPMGMNLSASGVLSGSPSQFGTFPVKITATDQNKCTGGTTVSLFIDQAPVPKCQNATVSAGPNCSATASIDNGSSDPDQGDTITLAQSPPGPYPLGNTTVTLTVTDNHGVSSQCIATVAVVDTTPPSIVCPANIVTTTSPGQCSTVVTFATPAATDNCTPSPQVVCAPPSGTTFPKGTTTVTCTATDQAGNKTTCTFTVTVLDNEPPKIVCPPDIVANTGNPLDPGTAVTFSPTVTDNCPGASFVCTPASGSVFPRGTTTVTCTATDASGNKSVCTFRVTVFDVCLQDDASGDLLKYNSQTGDYLFISCKTGFTIGGKGSISVVNSVLTLTDNQGDRRVRAQFIQGQLTGSAIIMIVAGPGLYQTYRINETNPHPSCMCRT